MTVYPNDVCPDVESGRIEVPLAVHAAVMAHNTAMKGLRDVIDRSGAGDTPDEHAQALLRQLAVHSKFVTDWLNSKVPAVVGDCQ